MSKSVEQKCAELLTQFFDVNPFTVSDAPVLQPFSPRHEALLRPFFKNGMEPPLPLNPCNDQVPSFLLHDLENEARKEILSIDTLMFARIKWLWHCMGRQELEKRGPYSSISARTRAFISYQIRLMITGMLARQTWEQFIADVSTFATPGTEQGEDQCTCNLNLVSVRVRVLL
jgi:hypothetical protein